MKNLYSVLEIDSTASPEQIKTSYKHLMRKHHPDHGGDEDVCKEINVAYGILSDPIKKREYDSLNIDQQKKKYDLITKFFKLFIYKDVEFDKLLDFFFYFDPTKSKFSKSTKFSTNKENEDKENNQVNKINKVSIILDVDEAYNKKFYKYTTKDDSYIVPVVEGEYSFLKDKIPFIIEVNILSSPTIKIKDKDIIVEELIDIHDYIYGFELDLKLPNKVIIKKKIDSFLHRDTIEIIENKGLFFIEDNYDGKLSDIKFQRGDLYIDFKVKDIDGTTYKQYSELKNKIKYLVK